MRFLILLILFGISCLTHADRVIHKEKSLYRNIVVKESGARRCLVFAVKRGDRNQTCKNLEHPNRVVFPYVRMTFAGLLLNPEPASVLVVGLGGGTIPTVLSQLFPEAVIDVVEIDEAVRRVARDYFDFVESDNVKVIVRDARVYIKRAGIQKRKYDMIILDAFTGDYIPEHLTTMEFLEEVKALLNEDGVLVANTFSTSKLYHHESVTYYNVFGDFFNFKMPITGNRVVITNGQPLPSQKQLQDRANRLSGRFTKYFVNIEDYPKYMNRDRDWDESKRPLTDQFAPANLLRSQED
jgi:spermidine synthase